MLYVQWAFEWYLCCYIRVHMLLVSFKLIIIVICFCIHALGYVPLFFSFGGWIRVHNIVCLWWPMPWSCSWFYFSFEFNLMLGITFPFFFVIYFWWLLYFSWIVMFRVMLLFVYAWSWTIGWYYEAVIAIIVILRTFNCVIVVVGRSAYISVNEVIICRFSTS